MFGSAVLDVAVGLIFIYFVMSVVCAQINEMLSSYFKWRAQDLERGIRSMLSQTETSEGKKKERSSLHRDFAKHPLIRALGDRPSYMPSRTFALALFDALAPGDGEPKTFGGVRDAIRKLPDDVGAKQGLLTILSNAQDDVDKARKGVEEWFDATMDRIKGVYKRRIMWVNLAVASTVVIVVGVDTIAVATTLWQEQAIRTAVAGTATQVSATGLEDAVNALDQFNLPLGWTWPPATFSGWLLKVIGLAVSILAVTLGAPFWFDVLQRVTNLRGAGAAPKVETDKEGAKPAPPVVIERLIPMALDPEERRV